MLYTEEGKAKLKKMVAEELDKVIDTISKEKNMTRQEVMELLAKRFKENDAKINK